MQRRSFRILTQEDVKRALTMEQAITLMKDAFLQLSRREAVVPVRMNMNMTATGEALIMPVYLPGSQQVGLKLVSICKDNPSRGLPLIQALVMVMDGVDGRPLGLMDGAYLTALRTGAATGLATDLLARLDARTLALFGAGAQARTQLEAVCAVRAIEHVFVFAPDLQSTVSFCREMSDLLAVDVTPAASKTLLQRADIVCTATTSTTPVFSHSHLRDGTHINAIGAYRPDMREIPGEIVSKACLVVDHRPSCLSEAGDLVIPISQGLFDQHHIQAEIGEIVAGDKPGRTAPDEITLFKSVGNAVQDLAVASQILANAEALELGALVSL